LFTGIDPRDVHIDAAMKKLSGKPILLLFGERDPLIPPAARESLLQAAGPNAQLHVFLGSTHGDMRLVHPLEYRQRVAEFVAATTPANGL
jgi:pimeloyl-ACP methyl ester carboxylesterase